MRDKNIDGRAKKPFYKKWWVWVLAVFVIIIIGSLGGNGSDNETVTPPAISPTAAPTEGTGTNQETTTEKQVTPITEKNNAENIDGTKNTDTTVTPNITASADNITLGEKNALKKAKDYLSFTAFSYSGLIDQLKYEGFSEEEAKYAVDNCGADWNEQAAKKAKAYLDYSSFSRSGLIDQLEYEGFTSEQAQYGAKAVGY